MRSRIIPSPTHPEGSAQKQCCSVNEKVTALSSDMKEGCMLADIGKNKLI
jgi:hypothetical protein